MTYEGFFKIREEVLLILAQRFSLSREEVLSELYVLVREKLKIPRECKYFNARRWNVCRYKSSFRGYNIYVNVSTHEDSYICVRVTIPKHTGDRVFFLENVIVKADSYVREQLEKTLEF
jgi:hypothetical protein